MTWRWVYYINRKSKSMLKHIRNNPSKQFTTDFQARIRIDLNQPYFEVIIDHEIQSKYLEIMLQVIGVKLKVR